MSDIKKFLDYEGVQHLWSKINMNDYPNNETLMAVINAIDETKVDKIDGKGLSTNDFTNGYKEKLDGLENYATKSYVNEGLATKQPIGDYALKSDIPDVSSAIIDVTELPTENIREDAYYRKLTGSLVLDQVVQNAYICHCVESLPEIGLPVTDLSQTEGHIYYTVGDSELYGYVDDMLSSVLGVSIGWYPGATLLETLGFGYSGVITNIMNDPKDGNLRLLLEYVIYSYKNSWTSHKTIGWAGTGPSSEIFNDPMNIASGDYSHAEGSFSHAEGDYSHAEGYASHAEGNSSHAEGYASHAEGYASHTEGDASHAEGYASHAEGYTSHAVGRSQHVQGEFNLVDPEYNPDTPHSRAKYAHIVGNGTSDTECSNAHTLDWNGNAWFAGNIYIGGTGQDDTAAIKVAIVPFPAETDEGKFLRIVNGVPTWVSIPNAEEATF